jgi:predicted ester cyclase
MGSEQNEAAVDRAARAWNAGDLPGYLELYDESIKLHGYSPEPMDKSTVRGFYEQVFAAFDGPQLTFHEVFSSGERLVIRFTMAGTHRGEFLGVAPTGREVAIDGITILHFRDGKCIERWSQADMLGYLVQVGAVPAPGAPEAPPATA